MIDAEAAHARATHRAAQRTEQHIALTHSRWLDDRGAGPLVFPEHRAIRCDAGQARVADVENLCHAIDGHEVRRAVTPPVHRTKPSRLASRTIVGDELTIDTEHDEVVDHRWRAGEAPLGNALLRVGPGVSRPDHFAAARVERIPVSY